MKHKLLDEAQSFTSVSINPTFSTCFVPIFLRTPSPDVLDAFGLSFELVFPELIVEQTFNSNHQNIDEACELIRNALCTISSMQDVQRESTNVDSIEQPTVVISGRVGRPKFEISHDQLSFLLENRFTIVKLLIC